MIGLCGVFFLNTDHHLCYINLFDHRRFEIVRVHKQVLYGVETKLSWALSEDKTVHNHLFFNLFIFVWISIFFIHLIINLIFIYLIIYFSFIN